MSNVVNLNNEHVGDGIALDCDDMLEAAKGKLIKTVIIGIDGDGDVYLSGSHSRAESMMLLQFALHEFCSQALDD